MTLPDLLLDPGIDRLDQVAELTFTVTSGETQRTWIWAPGTQRTTALLPDGRAVSFTFGYPVGEEQGAFDAAFTEDHFWLVPQLHARWGARYLVELGPTTFQGRAVRWLQLRYPPEAGGHTPGDTHDLYVAPSGQIVGWALHPRAEPMATRTASFEDPVPLGPLTIARARHLAGGGAITVSGLDWTPAGLAVSVDPAGLGDFVFLTAARCRIGPLDVARSAPPPRQEPVLLPEETIWDRQMVVRDGPTRTVHRWSSETLRLEDAGWLHDTGIAGCELSSVDEGTIRAALARVTPADRAALLTLVTEWTLATVPVPGALRPLAAQIHRTALTCAEDGRCEPLVNWLSRLR